jgi:3-hydroxyisobutyrate dehydrogenase-like beta-hydroxyacid dehydrogenase
LTFERYTRPELEEVTEAQTNLEGLAMKIGFLGLGNMGTPMALRLIASGHELSVWNRNEERLKPLIQEGAIAAATPAEAETGADAVITMLFDDAAYEEVIFGANGLFDALSPGALHISCSTISVALSERLTLEYTKRGIDFVGAPVFGRPDVAKEGRLWMLTAGTERAIDRARPLLHAVSRGMSVVGNRPWQAHAVKLGGNFLIGTMIESLAEAFVFAAQLGVDPDNFIEAVNSALFQSPFYAAYANIMLHPPDKIGATIELGAKDLRLLREAAANRQTHLMLADQIAEILDEARRSGEGGKEWAVAQYRIAKRRGEQ